MRSADFLSRATWELVFVGALSLVCHGGVPLAEAHAPPPAPPGAAARSTAPPWLCKEPLRAADFPSGDRARDLAHVRAVVRGKRAQQRFDEEMTGKPNADAPSPGFVDAARARAWTDHPAATLEYFGARAWRGVAERWIVIAAGRSEFVAQGLDVRLALLEVTGTGASQPSVKRLARSTEPLAARAQFGLLPDDFLPTTCENGPCADPLSVEQADQVALDFAPYEIAPGERAFGVRTKWTEGYAGGYGAFEALSLFRADGDRLLPILAVPVSVQKMIAGDWNADGSRQHDVYQAALVLRMEPGVREGANIALVPRGGKARTFAWDPALGAYRCRAR